MQRIACRAYIRLLFQVSAMIGSLEFGGKFQFSKDAQELFASKPQTHDSQYLKRVKEPWGLPVTVHYHHRYQQIHKLQFLNVTHLSKSVVINALEHLVDDDIAALPTRRIDFTVDIHDVPVFWCREAFLFGYKQDSQEYAKCLGTQSRLQTVRYGSYKNCLLVYDKVAERLCEYGKQYPDGGPTFEAFSGFATDATVTRIERKIQTRIPACLATFADVLLNASTFNPFERLTIVPPAVEWPEIEDGPYREYIKHVFWQAEASKFGCQEAYKRANAFSGGNAKRILGAVTKVDASKSTTPITTEMLFQLCSETTAKQLGE